MFASSFPLFARGSRTHERQGKQVQAQQEAFDSYVRQASGTSGGASSPDQLAKVVDLKRQGVLTDAVFEAQTAKILS